MTKILPFIFCAFFSIILFGQEFECTELQYDLELDLSLLPEKKVYFLGETHNISSNDLIDFQFIKYLNGKYGVRTFIKEGSYSYVYFLNEYLQTGKEKLLDTLSNSLGYHVNEQGEFLKELYNLNSTLSKNERLEIYSIDAESFFHTPELSRYWKEKWGPPKNRIVTEVLKELESYKSSSFTLFPEKEDEKGVKSLIKRIRPLINKNEDIFKSYLKDDFIHLKMILGNNATLNRNEKSLASNFELLNNLITRKRYFFSYGKLHAQKKKGWLANRINDSYNFKNSVISIKPLYKNSTFYWRGEELELNDYEELTTDQKSTISSLECKKNWLILKSELISNNSIFDFYIIASRQKGITIIDN